MKKKHKVCFVFAIIFTVLALVCVTSCIGMTAWLYGGGGDGFEDDSGYGTLIVLAALGMAVMAVLIFLFFCSFGGVVTSVVNFNCPNEKIRLSSRIMLGFDGVCMIGCVVLFLYSIIIA